MPFITEEIWQQVAPRAGVDGDTIMTQPFPQVQQDVDDPTAEDDVEWIKDFVLGIRQIRGEMNIAPGKLVPVIMQNASAEDQHRASEHAALLARVGRVESVSILGDGEQPPASATALLGDVKLLVPMQGLIDVEAERARLDKQREKIEADLSKTQAKLGNENFVNNAPAAVVEQERERATGFGRQLTQLAEQLEKLNELS